MKTSKQKLGAWGEEQAASYLTNRGYEILNRNVRTPYGEIDVIARQHTPESTLNVVINQLRETTLVFVEVKTRRSLSFGYPEEAVDQRKAEHLLAAVQAYLQEHPELDEPWRIDVIAVRRFRDRRPPEILHFENAITS